MNDWRTRSECLDRSWLFDSRDYDGGEGATSAKQRHRLAVKICTEECPVLAECRQAVLNGPAVDGIAAGMTEDERIEHGVIPEPLSIELVPALTGSAARERRRAVVARMAEAGNDGSEIAVALIHEGLTSTTKVESVRRQVERDKQVLGVRTASRHHWAA